MPGTHSIKFVRSSNQRCEITDAAQTGLDLSSTLTFECWIKGTGNVGADDIWQIVRKWDATGNQRSYYWAHIETGSVDYRARFLSDELGDGTKFDGAYARPGNLANAWHHYAVTYDISLSMPASVVYYIDGEILTSVTEYDQSPTSIFNGTAPFEVGGSTYSTNTSSNMQMDELRIWSVVRTQAQIRALMYSQAVGNESGLVSCWHFDNSLVDAVTANGNDLTAVNSPTFVADDVGDNRYAGKLVAEDSLDVYTSSYGGFDGILVADPPGEVADTVAPVIANLTPVSGNLAATRAAAASQPIEFDVTDLDPGLRLALVVIKYAGDPKRYVVHDGSDFIWPYNGPVSARTTITDGFHYKILPAMGWQDDITELFVYAVDAAGNLEGSLP